MRIYSKILMMFTLVALLPLAVAGVYSYLSMKRLVTEQVIDHLQSVASIQKSRIVYMAHKSHDLTALVASRSQLRARLRDYNLNSNVEDQVVMSRILKDALPAVEHFEDIYVMNTEGIVVASTDEEFIDRDRSLEEDFLTALAVDFHTHRVVMVDGKLMAWISMPIMLEGEYLGVVSVLSDMDELLEVTSDYTGLGKTGETVLARGPRGGTPVFIMPLRFDPEAALKRIVPIHDPNVPMTQALGGNETTMTDAVDYQGKKVMSVTKYIDLVDWGIVVKMDLDEVYAPANLVRDLFLGIFAAISILVLAVTIIVSRSMTSPIIGLSNVAIKIRNGDHSARFEHRANDEFGELSRTFNLMSDNLLRVNAMLTTQQETSLDGILVIDEGGEFVNCNKKFAEIWQLPAKIIEDRNELRILNWEKDQVVDPDEFVEKIKYLYEHRDEVSSEEIELKDGRIIDRYSAPMYGEGGTYYGRVWYFRDITDRKAAEAKLRERLDELERFRGVTVGREFAMHDMKEEMKALKERLRELEGLSQKPPEVT